MTLSISTGELANRWARSERWIAQQAKAGDIPGAWKLGHLWRFRLSDIEAYEESQMAAPSIFALRDLAQKRLSNHGLRKNRR